MLHIVDTTKDVETAVRDLEDAVKRNQFGVLNTLDLQAKMKEKGIDFPHACRILEVCNPLQASRVLAADMSVSTALPCRISVYEEAGRTKIGTLLPTAMLAGFPGGAQVKAVAEDVEDKILRMIDEAK